MTTKENIAAVRRFWESFNAHNLDVWDEVCTPNFVNHDPGLPTPEADLETIKQTIGAMQTAFPDMTSSEEELIAEGNTVAVRRIMRGTHKGEFMDIAATDRPIEFGGVWIAHLSDGKIHEQWVYFDAVSLLKQIGAIPAPG